MSPSAVTIRRPTRSDSAPAAKIVDDLDERATAVASSASAAARARPCHVDDEEGREHVEQRVLAAFTSRTRQHRSPMRERALRRATGARPCARRSAYARYSGDSSTRVRIQTPTPISSPDAMKATRQPHAGERRVAECEAEQPRAPPTTSRLPAGAADHRPRASRSRAARAAGSRPRGAARRRLLRRRRNPAPVAAAPAAAARRRRSSRKPARARSPIVARPISMRLQTSTRFRP